nr:hypothetical protein B456_011G265300 [Gossypium raimondii]
MMEQVIFTDGLVEEHQGRNQMFFFNLDSLRLDDLPKLTSWCFENYFEFHCLAYLTLRNCPLLKTFISKCVPGDEPQIGQHVQASNLEVHNSSLLNEKVVFPSLKKLWIENCDSLEEIIELERLIADESQSTSAAQSIMPETVTTKFVFPKLINLVLYKVPRLKSFYSRMHTTLWPSLKQMSIEKFLFHTRRHCISQTEVFATKVSAMSSKLFLGPSLVGIPSLANGDGDKVSQNEEFLPRRFKHTKAGTNALNKR